MKNLPANAGGIRDAGLIPGTGRSPGEGNDTHSSNLVWRTPRAEEPGHSPWGRRESDATAHLERVAGGVARAQPPGSLPSVSSQGEREAPGLRPQPTRAHRALPLLSQVFAQWGLLPVPCAPLEDHSSSSLSSLGSRPALA